MITHAYEKEKERLFELVKENNLDGSDDFLKVLKQKEQTTLRKMDKFRDLLKFGDDPVYDLNKIYKDDKSLLVTACEYGNSKIIKLLVNHDQILE